jgi:pyruvate/2-oxoglutarate/acetoin dehydrogenase E1 component
LWDYRLTIIAPIWCESRCCKSIAKTNRLLVIDEDVPGGSAYILQQIIEQQDAYNYLDSKTTNFDSKAHRPAYGTDGDYFSKPSSEDILKSLWNDEWSKSC